MTERRTTGILRRDAAPQALATANHTELLVFGYQCKIYRDDSKAIWIDQGKHLIPCPSSPTLKVDRYDVRGALSDLAKYESVPGGYGDRLACLPPAERRAEELCEEERYWSLYNHDVDEEFYQETATEQKSNGAQIGFSYDQDQNVQRPAEEEEPNEPFVAPRKFFIPPNMIVPETMKQQAVIEKTAKFIASQGVQMEILLKAKQSNNPQFSFLLHEDPLNAYYKHMLDAIKNHNYPMEEEKEEPPPEPMQEVIPVEPRPIIPVAKYAPTQDCVYFKLMNSIGKISGIPTPAPVNGNDSPSSNQEAPVMSSGLRGLVEYNSDTESEDDNDSFDGELPPEQILHIIDKTAVYVNKNGADFEKILMTKQDQRFEFLNPGHEYHAYYKFKLHGKPPDIIKASKVEPKEPAPVSFSIKTQEVPPVKQLPVVDEESSSGDEDISKYDIANIMEPKQPPPTPPTVISDIERKMQEARRAEERIRDKLAAAAREKLNAMSKEKQLQLERKKKALAFLNNLKQGSSDATTAVTVAAAAATAPPPPPPSFPTAPPMGPITYESDASVHSLPSPGTPEVTVEISSDSDRGRERRKRKHKEEKPVSTRHKKKSKKSSHKSHKKKSRTSRSSSNSSRSRSRSPSRTRSRSRSRHKRYRR